jgi:hypothetical protein
MILFVDKLGYKNKVGVLVYFCCVLDVLCPVPIHYLMGWIKIVFIYIYNYYYPDSCF